MGAAEKIQQLQNELHGITSLKELGEPKKAYSVREFGVADKFLNDIAILECVDSTNPTKSVYYILINEESETIRKELPAIRSAKNFLVPLTGERRPDRLLVKRDLIINALQLETRNKSNFVDDDNERVREIDKMFEEADKLKASDIHISSNADRSTIMFRVNGELELWGSERNQQELFELVKVLYSSLAAEDGTIDGEQFKETEQQDGVIYRNIGKKRLGGRITSHPTDQTDKSFRMVIRVLGDQLAVVQRIQLENLGFAFNQPEIVRATLNGKGLLLIIGETNSGKSVTQQNCLMEIDEKAGGTKSIYSMENPIERYIDGIEQFSISASGTQSEQDTAMRTEKLLKFFWRADPDVLALGEIRDKMTSSAAVQMALTGHSVFSTLHCESPFDAFERLTALGANAGVLVGSKIIKCVVAQKLVQKLCPTCSVGIGALKEPTANQLTALNEMACMGLGKFIKNVRFRNPDSNHQCENEECRHGIVGRELIAECVSYTTDIGMQLKDGNKEQAKVDWLRDNGYSKEDVAIHKIRMGLIDPASAIDAFETIQSTFNLREKYNIEHPRNIYG